jgi:hypothetical protein
LPVSLQRLANQALGPVRLDEVDVDSDHAVDPAERLGRQRAADDECSFSGEQFGDCEPDALARAGDDGHLAVQFEIRGRSVLRPRSD